MSESAAVQETQASPANPASDPVQVFARAAREMQSGQLQLAEGDFRKVIALDPKSGPAYVNLGVTFMRQKRWDDALTALRQADLLSPEQSGILLDMGLAYYRKSDFFAAIEPFAATLKLAPDSLQARYLLGLCYFFTNRYKEATGTLAPLWDREAANLNYLYVLSIAASKSSNPDLQRQAFDRMLAVGRNIPEFHLYVGKAWLAEGDTAKALAEFQAAASARPDMPLVHYFLGRSYLEDRSLSKAEAEFEEDSRQEPDFAYNYEELGMLNTQLGKSEKAERCFREATERNGMLVNSWFGLAKLYRDQQRYREALEMLDHAVSLAPQSASVHYTRGQVLARLGRQSEAHQEFDASASLLKSFNDRLQQDPSGVRSADAQDAAQQ